MKRLRLYALIVLVAAVTGAVLLYNLPETYGLTRLSFTCCLGLAVLAVGVALHRQRLLLGLYAGFLLLALAAVLVPGGTAPTTASYTRELRAFLGVPYHLGGENGRSIDCSGLLREGYVQACIADAWTLRDPRLLRRAADVWYHDCSAEQILHGYDGRVAAVLDDTTINSVDYATLRPGDMAVTGNGVHCLVYLGDHAWASADPGSQQVVIKPAPDQTFEWYGGRVGIRRWRALQ